jgi:hypothetical protein
MTLKTFEVVLRGFLVGPLSPFTIYVAKKDFSALGEVSTCKIAAAR